MTILPRFSFTNLDRYARARRNQTIMITMLVGLFTAATAAGMIYLYYNSLIPRH